MLKLSVHGLLHERVCNPLGFDDSTGPAFGYDAAPGNASFLPDNFSIQHFNGSIPFQDYSGFRLINQVQVGNIGQATYLFEVYADFNIPERPHSMHFWQINNSGAIELPALDFGYDTVINNPIPAQRGHDLYLFGGTVSSPSGSTPSTGIYRWRRGTLGAGGVWQFVGIYNGPEIGESSQTDEFVILIGSGGGATKYTFATGAFSSVGAPPIAVHTINIDSAANRPIDHMHYFPAFNQPRGEVSVMDDRNNQWSTYIAPGNLTISLLLTIGGWAWVWLNRADLSFEAWRFNVAKGWQRRPRADRPASQLMIKYVVLRN